MLSFYAAILQRIIGNEVQNTFEQVEKLAIQSILMLCIQKMNAFHSLKI